jgi:hypothetical protein
MPEVDGGIIKLVKQAVIPSEFMKNTRIFTSDLFPPEEDVKQSFSKEELNKGSINPNLRAPEPERR